MNAIRRNIRKQVREDYTSYPPLATAFALLIEASDAIHEQPIYSGLERRIDRFLSSQKRKKRSAK